MISLLFTKFRIHPLFWLIIAAGMATGHLWEAAIAFFIVLIHECGHAAMALHFGWIVKKIELLPFGGVAELDENGDDSFRRESAVILAGPLMNVVLALIGPFLVLLPFWGTAQQEIFRNQNLAILLFNLLPAWPLDGGRLLHLVLQQFYPFRQAYRYILIFSWVVLILFSALMLWLFSFSASFVVVALFLTVVIFKEWRAIPLHFIRFLLALSRRTHPAARIRNLYLRPETRLVTVFSMFYRNSEHHIFITGSRDGPLEGRRLVTDYLLGRHPGPLLGDCRDRPADRFI
ncbi:M50 family metallopeptidase [Sporolactobacillus vineae]|uniref:M50 family metallopeptidase n=1 Tax=Sporolactobacillus vineae TaxID=444463 RepID=UPI0002897048|nr:M50 family metallopeptidase [Sporolactobacillus vineae]